MNSSNKHLFTFADAGGFEGFQAHTNAFSPGLDFSAPVLCPPDTTPKDFYNISEASGMISTIDVLNNFDWTLNAGHSRKAMDDIPYIRMSEYAINFNSFLQNLKFMLNVGADAAKSTGVLESAIVTGATEAAQGAAQAAVDTTDSLLKMIVPESNVKAAVKEIQDGIKENSVIDQSGVPKYLRPYNGLYGVRPTGFQYKIPYFDADWKTVRNTWGDITGGGILGSLANIGGKVAGGFVEAGAMMKTGAYFERPKSYAFDDTGEAITFKFPLYNTRSFEEVQKNFELVLMLTYQQLANKMSHVLLDPPVIYDIEIPGKFYTPYGYIANLSIQGIGAQRLQTMELLSDLKGEPSSDIADEPFSMPPYSIADDGVGDNPEEMDEITRRYMNNEHALHGYTDPKRSQPSSGKPTPLFARDKQQNSSKLSVKAIIPDMWEVTITMQSLVPNTKNLFYHSLAGAESLFDTSISRQERELVSNAKEEIGSLPDFDPTGEFYDPSGQGFTDGGFGMIS